MRYRTPLVFLFCAALCLTINFVMGKDMNSDMLAYHVYSAHMLWTGGYKEEFMGAGLQSFFNPVGYLPFYGMIQAGWPALVIGSSMAILHSLNLLMVWLIGRDVLFKDCEHPELAAALGVLIAAVSPVFIALVGSSFLDPLQSAIILGGIYLCCKGVELLSSQKRAFTRLFAGGLLIGMATGLKPTVATTPIFCLIGILVVTWRFGRLRESMRYALYFSAGTISGGLLTGGFWALHLWQRFGSPVFPFANDVFRSPDFFATPLTTDRFIPESWADLLAFPFRMAKINSGIYVEIAAPDIRFAALILVLAAVVYLKWSATKRHAVVFNLERAPSVLLVWILFAGGVTVWMAKLGNGRYHLSYLLLVGPLLLWGLMQIWGKQRIALLAGLWVLAAQFSHALSMGYPRWESGSWTKEWVRTSWPQELPRSPATWVQVGPGIESFVFPEFPAGSRFLDLGGKFPVPPESPLGPKMKAVLNDTSRPLLVIFKARASPDKELHSKRKLGEDATSQLDHLLAPWDLRLAGSECIPIEVELDRDEVNAPQGGKILLAARRYALVACALARGAAHNQEDEEIRRNLQSVAGSLTQSCPTLFPPPASLPTRSGPVWTVRYIGSDITLALSDGNLTYSKFPFGPFNVPISIDSKQGIATTPCIRQKQKW